MAHAEHELPTFLAPSAARPAERVGIPEVYAAIAALSFLVARFVPVLRLHYPCVFLAATGHPCATCGMTRAFVHLAHGHVVQAFQWSPLGALLAAGAWLYAVADLVRVAAGWPFPAIAPRRLRLGLGALAAVVLVNWTWLWVHGLGP